jgi:hypothetical protein
MLGQEELDNDVAHPSISSCFSSAVSAMPAEVRLMEIRYRGLHMGTFEVIELMERADNLAQKIVSGYGALIGENQKLEIE